MADPDAIGQVVSNLMQNAARYTDDGGEVVVRLRAQSGWVRCEIENTGAEISSTELPYIWERLYRVDRSRTRATGGTGIGLAIVRQIIESHGGSVGARSGNGRTAIWFQLPSATASPAGPDIRERRRRASAAARDVSGARGQSTTMPNGVPPPGIATGDEPS